MILKLKENLHLLQKQINEVKTQLIKISNIHMEQQPNELAEKILRSKEKSEQDLQVLGSKLQREQITFNNGLKENTVFVTNKIFPRVDVQFNTHHLVTKREYSPSKISYSGYEIDVEPIMIKRNNLFSSDKKIALAIMLNAIFLHQYIDWLLSNKCCSFFFIYFEYHNSTNK